MKRVYWIEDNIEKALQIAYETYYALWGKTNEDGIASTMIFFGDHFKEGPEDSGINQESAVNQFNAKIKRLLVDHCINEDQWNYNGASYKKKSELIKNASKLISDEDQEISGIIKAWKDENHLSKYKLQQDSSASGLSLNGLISKMELEEKSYVAIDAALLQGDFERIEKQLPIIAMELYQCLSGEHKCFFYSTFTYDYAFISKFKELYKDIYHRNIEVRRAEDIFNQAKSGIAVETVFEGLVGTNDEHNNKNQ